MAPRPASSLRAPLSIQLLASAYLLGALLLAAMALATGGGLAGLLLLAAVAVFALGIGLWGLRDGAWLVAVLLHVASAVADGVALTQAGGWAALARAALHVATVVVLFRTSGAFGRRAAGSAEAAAAA